MHQLKFAIIFLLPIFMFSQNITGKIYDQESTVKGAKIYNTIKRITTYTDNQGDFKLSASVNDTLIFTSLFHKEKRLKLIKNHFNEVLVIELKKIVNDLDEVLITKENKTFNEKTHTTDLGLQLKNDIKNNPHLYGLPPSGNIDFIKIFGLVSKLFKNKKVKTPPIVKITYKQFDSLFSNSNLFNNKLLINDLKVSKEYRLLFFDYCEAQNLDNKLLLEENKVLLLDKLFNFSNEFFKILSEYEKSGAKN
ncbi:hypothetical protein [uncultured Wocania sp.]|mgnify:CR=1 FL=1|uniref:carboxypeptidase-like regulatory domain-containing protein n=1 Tax=uncultured Wocania sp. TaxID=2834404 RepID=UPI0030FCF092